MGVMAVIARKYNRNGSFTNLKTVVDKHVKIFQFLEKMNEVYVPFVIVKSLLIAIYLCTLGFQITEVKNIFFY